MAQKDSNLHLWEQLTGFLQVTAVVVVEIDLGTRLPLAVMMAAAVALKSIPLN
jgi:hypothetical protein